jgi:predicted RND superfamily exporter protein
METVVRAVDVFLQTDPPPVGIRTRWFGLTYINVIWQDKMVAGMLQSFAGSFLVVFLMMVVLFRSALWGLLSMIPLTVTIATIYGAVGLVGKDYDMPVAVLSSLTLGLAVDFAIHFLARAREMHRQTGSWETTAPAVFGEPARAITRNIIVIAAGFTPLLLAPLVPYKTVGILLATILLVSGVGTLLILPALIRVLERWLFRPIEKVMAPSCNCGLCIIASIVAVVLLALNLYGSFGWGPVTWASIVVIPILVFACGWMSRRAKCRVLHGQSLSNKETSDEQD